jgi:phosphoglycolate phosphatase-like HAD superfamily hydrolase
MRRLILFDIDGTLVNGGPAKTAFETAMLETYGTTGDVGRVSFGGKTDPQIARELLSGVGFEHERIERGFPELWERYLRRLEAGLRGRPMSVLPGVGALLDALDALEGIALGLLTGNIARGAELKLDSAGLWRRFPIGSYGSDSEVREELPAFALERANAYWSRALGPRDAVIVGDTPRDVACGRAAGIRTLAVATGRFTEHDLEGAGADHVLTDLTATERVVALLVD